MMDDLISRKDTISAIMGEHPEAHYPDWYARIIEEQPSARLKSDRDSGDTQPEEAIPVSWITAQIERLKGMDNLFADLTADIIQTTLNEWRKGEKG